MEVHPPDHTIHSWRDFFIHIATIVVGLLIAIGLEQSVEWLHHRSELRETRERLREEMAGNRALLEKDFRFLTQAEELSRYNIGLLGATPTVTPLRYGWSWNGLEDAAYTTARQTGTLALMPYDEAQQLAVVYGQQALVNAESVEHIHRYTQSLAPVLRYGELQRVTVAQLTPAERQTMLQSYAVNLTEISALEDLMRSLQQLYGSANEGR